MKGTVAAFPLLFPDELLVSALARFVDRMRVRSQKDARLIFFDSRRNVRVELTRDLNQLIATLLPGHGEDVDRWIDSHTAFPYYSAFVERTKADLAREDMRSPKGSSWVLTQGRNNGNAWLRFCPQCFREEEGTHGEPYWHRLHQIWGVHVCPTHLVFLQDSTVSRLRSHEGQLKSAKLNCQVGPIEKLSDHVGEHQVLLRLAIDVQWLLEHSKSRMEMTQIRNQLKELLGEHNCATPNSFSANRFADHFYRRFSSQEWRHIPESNSSKAILNWARRLISTRRYPDQAPLHYLLMLQAIGCTAERFFTSIEPRRPFGTGPWPCINRFCRSYRKQSITSYSSQWVYHGRPERGHFECPSCRYSYSASGKIWSDGRTSTFGEYRMLWPGGRWLSVLKRYWAESSLTISQVATRVGINRRSVQLIAIEHGLSNPRLGPEGPVNLVPTKRQTLPQSMNKWRGTAREWRRANPKAPLLAFRTHHVSACAWLTRHDRAWLHRLIPPVKGHYRKPLVTPQQEWRRREQDSQMALLIPKLLPVLKFKSGVPTRVTVASVQKALGVTLSDAMDRFPLTQCVLAKEVESNFDFAQRRIAWAIDRFREAPTPNAGVFLRWIGHNLALDPVVTPLAIEAFRTVGLAVPKTLRHALL